MTKANEVLQELIDRDVIGLNDFYNISICNNELRLQGLYNDVNISDITTERGFKNIVKTFESYPKITAYYQSIKVVIVLTD